MGPGGGTNHAARPDTEKGRGRDVPQPHGWFCPDGAGEARVGTPRPPSRLGQKREETAPHSAAGSGGWNRTNLSRVRAGRPTDRRRRCMARAGLPRPGKRERKKEKDAVAAHGWRQGRASNPQIPLRGSPVFGTGWHSRLPSLPYMEPRAGQRAGVSGASGCGRASRQSGA